jgi:hypothetical protein
MRNEPSPLLATAKITVDANINNYHIDAMQITDAIPQLPPDIVRHELQTLIGLLPRPMADTPEGRNTRDGCAIAAVAALRPADAFQLMLAVQIVGMDAHAMECLRLAASPGQSVDIVRQARSQACALLRVTDASLRDLLRMQAQRDTPAATRSSTRHAQRPAPRTADRPAGDPAKPKLYLLH